MHARQPDGAGTRLGLRCRPVMPRPVRTIRTTAVAGGLARCRDTCALTGFVGWHHDRLLAVEEDPEAIVELMELAVTWSELDYSDQPVISPDHWMSFFASHRWTDSDTVERIFSVAHDIATTATGR